MNGRLLTKTEFNLDRVRRAWLDRNRTEDEPIQRTRLAVRRHAATISKVRKSSSTEYQPLRAQKRASRPEQDSSCCRRPEVDRSGKLRRAV